MSEYTRDATNCLSLVYHICKLKDPTINDSYVTAYNGDNETKIIIRSVLCSYNFFTNQKSPIVRVTIKYKYKRDRHSI